MVNASASFIAVKLLSAKLSVVGDCHNAIVTLPTRFGVFADVGAAVGAGGTVGGT